MMTKPTNKAGTGEPKWTAPDNDPKYQVPKPVRR